MMTAASKVSVTADRAKTRNLQRDPRATLSIVADNWHRYLVVEGTCTVIQDDPLPVLRRIYERIRGAPHPDWAEFDAAMTRDGRVVLSITVDRMYPLDRGSPVRRLAAASAGAAGEQERVHLWASRQGRLCAHLRGRERASRRSSL